jgi:predicted permease
MLRRLAAGARAVFARRRAERDLADEIAFHVEREIRRQLEAGLDPGEARRRALARFGSPAATAEGCRDVRYGAWIDAFARDLAYAWRAARRAPLASLAIVITVALGLGLVAAVFTVFNLGLFRADRVRNPDEIFAVVRQPTAGGDRLRFTRPQYEDLARETSVFAQVFAMLPDIDTRIDGRMMSGTLVTGTFFDALGTGPAIGRTLTDGDDRPGGDPVLVLSHSGWMRHFGGDPDVLGRALRISGATLEVVGVMPDGFRGLTINAPDFWAPLSLLGRLRPLHAGREDTVGLDIVGRLAAGVSPGEARAQLAVWDARQRRAGGTQDGTAAPLALEPRRGTLQRTPEVLALFTPLFFAFGLVLAIGCANVANLLLARGVARRREIGVRLALGASRQRIVRQLLTESLLLALAAAGLGYLISRGVLAGGIHALTRTMPPDFGDVRLPVPAADWRVALFLVAAAVVATLVFALAPARQATRVDLVRAMRGEGMRQAPPGRARSILVWLQVTASTLLLICSAVFLRSALASARVDPGLRTADTVVVEMVNESTRRAMAAAVEHDPSVALTAASWPDPLGSPRIVNAGGAAATAAIGCRFVSADYFEVLGIDILRGRAFTPAEASSRAAVAIVAERVARQLWAGSEPLGQTLQLEADPASPSRREDEPALPGRFVTVIGVARDVPGFRLSGVDEAGIYVPIDATAARTSLTVRVHGDPEVARRTLLDRLTTIDPAMGQAITLRTAAGIEAFLLRVAFWLTFGLGMLALVLTLSGLFSVLSYLVEQRAKELGVRLALGSTARGVVLHVIRQSAAPVGWGLAAGAGLAAAAGTGLLATPAAGQIGAIVRLFDPVAYAGSVLCVLAACAAAGLLPARRASRLDPVVVLRED